MLPLEIIRMKAKGCKVYLSGNTPGFTLPTNIGELGDDIVNLDLSRCSLQGITCRVAPTLRDGSELEISHAFPAPVMCRRNSRVDREPDEPADALPAREQALGCVIRFQNALSPFNIASSEMRSRAQGCCRSRSSA